MFGLLLEIYYYYYYYYYKTLPFLAISVLFVEGHLSDSQLCTVTFRIFVVPTLSMVGDPLSGKRCGSPNHI